MKYRDTNTHKFLCRHARLILGIDRNWLLTSLILILLGWAIGGCKGAETRRLEADAFALKSISDNQDEIIRLLKTQIRLLKRTSSLEFHLSAIEQRQAMMHVKSTEDEFTITDGFGREILSVWGDVLGEPNTPQVTSGWSHSQGWPGRRSIRHNINAGLETNE